MNSSTPHRWYDPERDDSGLGFVCDGCGLSDVGYARLQKLFPTSCPKPCSRCRDHLKESSP